MQTYKIALQFKSRSQRVALGFLIELFRRSQNISRAKLEEMADLPDRSLEFIERATRNVEALELQRIAAALGLTVEDLLPKEADGQHTVANRFGRSTEKS